MLSPEDSEKLGQMVTLLTEIRDVLKVRFPGHEAIDPEQYTCPCTRRNGEPIQNCPLCRGTGVS